MEYQFREEVRTAKKAAMGEMVNLAKANLQSGDRLINFASGHPSMDVFQDELIKKYMSYAAAEAREDVCSYDSAIGYAPLRDQIKSSLNADGNVMGQKDDLMITYGATEALHLTASALLEPGDKVIVEEPSYVNAIKAFQFMGGEVIGVHLDEDGINLEDLEEKMRVEGVKLFYTMPNFGNPSGITMSLEKRKAVYELAVKYRVLILEDNVYGKLRYQNEMLPSIKEFDEEGTVIYISSVSKWIAPAMRVGVMVANQELISRFVLIKEAYTANESIDMNQYALWKMFRENDMREQIQKVCEIYGKKFLLMQKCMDRYFPVSVKRSSPDGGMYIWVTLPEGSDAMSFCKKAAIQLHIPIMPGNDFFVNASKKCRSMRFNFAKESLEGIIYGIEKVGGFMRSYIGLQE